MRLLTGQGRRTPSGTGQTCCTCIVAHCCKVVPNARRSRRRTTITAFLELSTHQDEPLDGQILSESMHRPLREEGRRTGPRWFSLLLGAVQQGPLGACRDGGRAEGNGASVAGNEATRHPAPNPLIQDSRFKMFLLSYAQQ